MPERTASLRFTLSAILCCGVALHAYIALFEAAKVATLFNVGLFGWSCLPYAAALTLALLTRRLWVGIVGAALVLFVDAWTYYAVFVRPKGSTAALALLWMPFWNLIIVVPLGAAMGWLLSPIQSR